MKVVIQGCIQEEDYETDLEHSLHFCERETTKKSFKAVAGK